MATTTKVGIIGCGNIAAAYMRMASFFKHYAVVACADLNPDAANARAAEFGLRAETIDGLLAADDIGIVVNLTIPAAHFAVSKSILTAGKHVYSEKPYVLSVSEGRELAALAEAKGLRIGSAPDTFLGASHQQARALIDAGAIGKVTSGTAHVMSSGMEDWHPNPDFFFQPGAGPVLDLGPYYISNLVQLVGPVASVSAMTSTPQTSRTIGNGPREGEKVPVDTPTTVHALLRFRSGAVISYGTSWDVCASEHNNMEIYGEKGTLYVPDPNFFGGELRLNKGEGAEVPEAWSHPFAVPNDEGEANYRGAGLAEMALAIREERPHRCNDSLALHVVEVMTAILRSGETGLVQTILSSCERPAALSPADARGLIV